MASDSFVWSPEDVNEGMVDCDLVRLGLAERPRGRAIRAESVAMQLRATLRRTNLCITRQTMASSDNFRKKVSKLQ